MNNNLEDSNYREFESLNRSIDTEAAFLKKKLIETHHKLLKELELNKDMESKLGTVITKNEQLVRQNESLNRKLSNTISHDRIRQNEERAQTAEKRIVELQSKNELLRIDLESMRTRILSEMLEKSSLQESLKQKEERARSLEEQLRTVAAQLKHKEAELINTDRSAMALKQRNDLYSEGVRRLTAQLEEKKESESSMNSRLAELQAQAKHDREKLVSLGHEYKNREKELASAKSRLEQSEDLVADLRNKLYAESKEKVQVSNLGMQKLTQEFNSLSVKYRQLERELEQARTAPQQEYIRRRRDFTESRDLVERLEEQQRSRLGGKSQERRFGEKSHYKERSVSPMKQLPGGEKKGYLEKLSELGTLENTLLQCNISKNKILTEIDKIDATKVKTSDLISRRRRLEEDLKKAELLAEETKRKLKELNVI